MTTTLVRPTADPTGESFAAATAYLAAVRSAQPAQPAPPAWLTSLAAMVLGSDGYGSR